MVKRAWQLDAALASCSLNVDGLQSYVFYRHFLIQRRFVPNDDSFVPLRAQSHGSPHQCVVHQFA